MKIKISTGISGRAQNEVFPKARFLALVTRSDSRAFLDLLITLSSIFQITLWKVWYASGVTKKTQFYRFTVSHIYNNLVSTELAHLGDLWSIVN